MQNNVTFNNFSLLQTRIVSIMPSMVVTLSMQLRQDAMTIIPWHTQPRLVNRLVIAEELDQPWPKKWWLIPRLPWWLTLIFCHQKWVNFTWNWIFTDLGSLIGITQCGNKICLPLRFYVKSILVILNLKKLPFWPFEQFWF